MLLVALAVAGVLVLGFTGYVLYLGTKLYAAVRYLHENPGPGWFGF